MKTLATLCTLSFLVLGCGDDDRPREDGGIVLDRDGGGDTGTRADTGTRPDTGGGVDAGSTCREARTDLRVLNMDPMAMGMLLPRCSMDTATCLSACEDQACADACYAADTTPGVDVGGGTILDCEFCNNYQFEVCISEMCMPAYGTFICCAEANDCTGASCPACATELMAVQTCAQGLGASCNAHLQACF